MNIDNLSYQECLKLKIELDNKLDLNNDLWNAISNIKDLSIKKDEIDNTISQIEGSQSQLKSLINLGYTLVLYEANRVGFINYEKKRVEGKYHGCSFRKSENNLDFNNYIKPSNEDIKKMEEILLIKKEN